MQPLEIGLVLSHQAPRASTHLAWSALPDAPVVPDVDGAAAAPRTRAVLAGALYRLADAVSPVRPSGAH
jgi:hypothetical protein